MRYTLHMEYFFPILWAFLAGSIFGSFLNVVIDRLSTGRSVLFGRSYCEHCKKKLKITDLVPIFSYLFLSGKCRYCKAKIPFRLVVVEFICAVTLSILMFFYLTGGIMMLPAIFIGIVLFSFIGIFFADIEYGIIPDALVVVSAFSALFFLVTMQQNLVLHLISGVGTLLFFLTLFLVTRGKGMGFGDVKLACVLGLLLGFPNVVIALYLAFLTGAAVSIILVIWRKIRFFGGTIPFGPFMVASSILALFWGDVIASQFLGRLF